MCFVDIDKAFDRVPRKVMEWAMRKKDLPDVIVRAVMSHYCSAKAKVRGELQLSKEFLVQVDENKRICVIATAFCHCIVCANG